MWSLLKLSDFGFVILQVLSSLVDVLRRWLLCSHFNSTVAVVARELLHRWKFRLLVLGKVSFERHEPQLSSVKRSFGHISDPKLNDVVLETTLHTSLLLLASNSITFIQAYSSFYLWFYRLQLVEFEVAEYPNITPRRVTTGQPHLAANHLTAQHVAAWMNSPRFLQIIAI